MKKRLIIAILISILILNACAKDNNLSNEKNIKEFQEKLLRNILIEVNKVPPENQATQKELYEITEANIEVLKYLEKNEDVVLY